MEPENNTSTDDRQRLLQGYWEYLLQDCISVVRDSQTYSAPIDIVTVTYVHSRLTFHIVAGELDIEHPNCYLDLLEDVVRVIIPPITAHGGVQRLFPWGATWIGDIMTFYKRHGNDDYLTREPFSDVYQPLSYIKADFEMITASPFIIWEDSITDSPLDTQVNGAMDSDENGADSGSSFETVPTVELNYGIYRYVNSAETSEEE
ncbi:uncharacterized protein BO88DRAFT_429707 [Aspergillus vadensis CBS 113365]|uniref:Uncharacterized protein n=1 Tax=Aspergillus vadensis (strain CBS 113365 / IMI 142717 / IBT 24658) TaxID=1448311 RepID=A0A319BM77_ASPVC|nr:hypothetical protein BO88DRAFT_429707 [Aspergillus vadensis CBS 113365]PYH64358.1 hypothetical protein BO88DRAFT_429707 [Aspergillus vadensis CBS 113365]